MCIAAIICFFFFIFFGGGGGFGGLGGWKRSRVDFLNLIFNQYFKYFSFYEFEFLVERNGKSRAS